MATFNELSALSVKSEQFPKDTPISTPVQVKVLTKLKVVFKDITETKYVATTVISDNTCTMQCTVYSEAMARQYFAKDNCLMISNYVISDRDEQTTLIVTNKSVLFAIPNFAVKEDLIQQAALHLQDLPVTPIAEAILLPKKRRISIEGKVTKVTWQLLSHVLYENYVHSNTITFSMLKSRL